MKTEVAGFRNGTTHLALEHALLDDVYEKLLRGQIEAGMEELMPGLNAQRQTSKPQDWAKVVEICLQHPLRELLHEDPFTQRSSAKPRGYAGDAVLMDFIYSREEGWPLPQGTSELGSTLFDYLSQTPACEGVRARRGFIADMLDELVEEVHWPHVLSIAAGHMREINLCSAVKRRKIGRLVGLDADLESLQEIERCYGRLGVETFHASVGQLLTQRMNLGQFDVVYSTGLFDYLLQSNGQRLIWLMFQMLRPGGRLLVANFLPGIADQGYMESYMDWKLIYRTRQEMLDLSANIPQNNIRDIRLFAEENQNILFLQVTKR